MCAFEITASIALRLIGVAAFTTTALASLFPLIFASVLVALEPTAAAVVAVVVDVGSGDF